MKLITRTLILLLVSTAFLSSCSTDDNSNNTESPVVTYNNTNLEATFFTSGNSMVPNINWGGNQGTFSLNTSLSGLNVNTTTGVLNWTKDLPAGKHDLQVFATNSAGQTVINLTLDNPFHGVFIGTYDGTSFFEFEFNPDGTAIVRANNQSFPDMGSGTWVKEGNIIQVDYNYSEGDEFSVLGTLDLGANAVYSGNWFFDHGALSNKEGGAFEVILESN